MIDKKLEKKLHQLTKIFTQSVKRLAEEAGVKVDVAVKLNLTSLEQDEKHGGS